LGTRGAGRAVWRRDAAARTPASLLPRPLPRWRRRARGDAGAEDDRQRTGGEPRALHAARLFDAAAGRILTDVVVRIDGDRIASVTEGSPRAPDALDLGDVTLLPGMVEARTHLLANDEGDYLGMLPKKTEAYRTLEGAANARAVLRCRRRRGSRARRARAGHDGEPGNADDPGVPGRDGARRGAARSGSGGRRGSGRSRRESSPTWWRYRAIRRATSTRWSTCRS
jgi:hypothetical protein